MHLNWDILFSSEHQPLREILTNWKVVRTEGTRILKGTESIKKRKPPGRNFVTLSLEEETAAREYEYEGSSERNQELSCARGT